MIIIIIIPIPGEERAKCDKEQESRKGWKGRREQEAI